MIRRSPHAISHRTSLTGQLDRDRRDADLTDLGYDQELHRRIGTYASFATGFSFVSILTTVFQLFALRLRLPAAVRSSGTWPIVFAGQLTVALMFARSASRWPISGAIYQWSTRLGGRAWGWTAGWLMLVAQVVALAAAAIALQAVLPPIWSGFQILGGDSAFNNPTGAANAVLLGVVLLAFTTLVNVSGVHLTGRFNVIGVTLERLGVALLVVLLLLHAERGPSVITEGTGAGGPGAAFSGFVISSLMAAYVLVGFDSAAEMSEETHTPAAQPRAPSCARSSPPASAGR